MFEDFTIDILMAWRTMAVSALRHARTKPLLFLHFAATVRPQVHEELECKVLIVAAFVVLASVRPAAARAATYTTIVAAALAAAVSDASVAVSPAGRDGAGRPLALARMLAMSVRVSVLPRAAVPARTCVRVCVCVCV